MIVLCQPHDGRGFEVEFCGVHFDEVPEEFRARYIRRFSDAVEMVISCQEQLRWNPQEPKTRLARCFYEQVQKNLGPKGYDLRMYISIGTRLDLMGVDFFLCRGRRIRTFDLTVRPPCEKRTRADYVLARKHFVHNSYYELARKVARDLLPRN